MKPSTTFEAAKRLIEAGKKELKRIITDGRRGYKIQGQGLFALPFNYLLYVFPI